MKKESKIQPGYKTSALGLIPLDWEVKTLEQLCTIYVGRDLREENYSQSQNDEFQFPVYSNTVENEGLYGYYNYEEYSGESLTIVGRGAGLGRAFTKSGIYGAIGRLLVLFPKENVSAHYVTEYVNNKLNIHQESGGIPQLTGEQIAGYKIVMPQYAEQLAIASRLSTWDKVIQTTTQLIAQKELQKKWLMQQLLTGKKRLRGFKGKWGDVELGDLLIYEQPTNYLVKDTLYNDAYETPVLTAGKTFILGYTNEQNGICTDLPVIIFDDFTTSSKYVNFPFKAKSSAMKILRPKHNVNLKFVYEAMQLMNYVVGGHERHWISKFVYLTIPCPLPEEQIAIANIFQTVDKEIQILQNKLDKLKEQKKGLMQILLTGKKRLTVRTGLAPVPKKIK
mgnify:CR=1 FL=1